MLLGWRRTGHQRGIRCLGEQFSSYRRKSSSLTLELRTKCRPGVEKCLNFRDFFPLEIRPKMRDVLAKMRECGKEVKMRDFPHDCGMVDTYAQIGKLQT